MCFYQAERLQRFNNYYRVHTEPLLCAGFSVFHLQRCGILRPCSQWIGCILFESRAYQNQHSPQRCSMLPLTSSHMLLGSFVRAAAAE